MVYRSGQPILSNSSGGVHGGTVIRIDCCSDRLFTLILPPRSTEGYNFFYFQISLYLHVDKGSFTLCSTSNSSLENVGSSMTSNFIYTCWSPKHDSKIRYKISISPIFRRTISPFFTPSGMAQSSIFFCTDQPLPWH